MLSSGLTLIFSMMGVLNFAHASFYMIGAYFAAMLSAHFGFWTALVAAPLLVGVLGALVERYGLRTVHKYGHIPELLFTFGLSYVIVEVVQLIWGRASIPYPIPASLDGPLFTLYTTTFPIYRGFIMLVAVAMLISIYLLLTKTRIGLIIQAALTHPDAVEALGHNVPRVFMLVFGGGCALAGLAGVVGGNAFDGTRHGGNTRKHYLCCGRCWRDGFASRRICGFAADWHFADVCSCVGLFFIDCFTDGWCCNECQFSALRVV